MMRAFIFSFLLLGAVSLNAQNIFNYRYTFENYAATLFTGVVLTDTAYYVVGMVADSVYPYRPGILFVQFDLNGIPVEHKILLDSVWTYENFSNTLFKIDNQSFVTAGYSINYEATPLLRHSILIKYDQSGDTLWVKRYPNPYFPEKDGIGVRDFTPTLDGGFAILNAIEGESSYRGGDVYLIKLDSVGNIEWEKIYHQGKLDVPRSIIALPEGGYLIGITKDFTIPDDDYRSSWLLKVDNLGQEIWSKISPLEGIEDGHNDLLLLEDGILSASGTNGEIMGGGSKSFDNSIIKFSSEGNVIWQTSFQGKTNERNEDTRTTNVLQLADSNAYILAGMDMVLDLEDPDSIEVNTMGWLAKISLDGDSLWTRHYYYLSGGFNDHYVSDIKETPDGGFLMVGQARSGNGTEVVSQQGWLLKTDSYGCLVPDCHLINPVEENNFSLSSIKLFPNPASHFLNVSLNSKKTIESKVIVSNTEGKVILSQKIKFPTGNTQLSFDVSAWQKGTYFLTITSLAQVKSFAFVVD